MMMKLLEMSISAGVLILFVMLLRALLLGRLPKRIFVWLWLVALVRLLIPIDLPLRRGIATPLLRWLAERFVSPDEAMPASDFEIALRSSAMEADSGDSARIHLTAWSGELPIVCFVVWMLVVAGLGVFFLCMYVKEYRSLAQSLPLDKSEQSLAKTLPLDRSKQPLEQQIACMGYLAGDFRDCRDTTKVSGKRPCRIRKHDRVSTPLVWGFFRQYIILPKYMVDGGVGKAGNIEPTQMQYILTHELVHMRRHDNLWKLLSAAALCLHWYNPLVWCMYVLLARDIELSCDERVIAIYGKQSRGDYAAALLTLIQNRQKVIFCSGFGKNPTKERIVAIMKYKRLTTMGVVCAAVLLLGATTVFATGTAAKENAAQTQEEQTSDASMTKDDGDKTAELEETKSLSGTEETSPAAGADAEMKESENSSNAAEETNPELETGTEAGESAGTDVNSSGDMQEQPEQAPANGQVAGADADYGDEVQEQPELVPANGQAAGAEIDYGDEVQEQLNEEQTDSAELYHADDMQEQASAAVGESENGDVYYYCADGSIVQSDQKLIILSSNTPYVDDAIKRWEANGYVMDSQNKASDGETFYILKNTVD